MVKITDAQLIPKKRRELNVYLGRLLRREQLNIRDTIDCIGYCPDYSGYKFLDYHKIDDQYDMLEEKMRETGRLISCDLRSIQDLYRFIFFKAILRSEYKSHREIYVSLGRTLQTISKQLELLVYETKIAANPFLYYRHFTDVFCDLGNLFMHSGIMEGVGEEQMPRIMKITKNEQWLELFSKKSKWNYKKWYFCCEFHISRRLEDIISELKEAELLIRMNIH